MSEAVKFSLVKPTIQTPFKIDFEWWKKNDQNWRVYLHSFLCPMHQVDLEDTPEIDCIDSVDPVTAEVHQIDRIEYTLMNHCARLPEFLTANTTLINSVFRILLANGNRPFTPVEFSEKIAKDPEMILRTLSGPRIYQGIRPASAIS